MNISNRLLQQKLNEEIINELENKIIEPSLKMYERSGEHYGYPQCCMDSFRERTLRSHKSLYDELLLVAGLLKTGFIPCIDHLLLLSSKSITINELLKNRKCKHIFPKQCKITTRCDC